LSAQGAYTAHIGRRSVVMLFRSLGTDRHCAQGCQHWLKNEVNTGRRMARLS